MTLTDDEATLLLERLADTVSEGTAPVESLVGRGRKRRTRRRRTTTLDVGSVAALVTVTTVSAINISDPDRPGPDVGAAEAPVPPPGTRYVGQDRVVVAVPASWLTFTESVCAEPVDDYVRFAPVYTDYRCPAMLGNPPLGDLSGLTIDRSRTSAPMRGAVSCRSFGPPRCEAVIHLAGSSTTLRAVDVSGSRDAIDTLVDSTVRLPAGWTTVPYVETRNHTFPSLTDVKRGMRTAGLDLEVTNPELLGLSNGEPTVEITRPAMGEVVAEGATVLVTVRVSGY